VNPPQPGGLRAPAERRSKPYQRGTSFVDLCVKFSSACSKYDDHRHATAGRCHTSTCATGSLCLKGFWWSDGPAHGLSEHEFPGGLAWKATTTCESGFAVFATKHGIRHVNFGRGDTWSFRSSTQFALSQLLWL
jgi:hypothetical protein